MNHITDFDPVEYLKRYSYLRTNNLPEEFKLSFRVSNLGGHIANITIDGVNESKFCRYYFPRGVDSRGNCRKYNCKFSHSDENFRSYIAKRNEYIGKRKMTDEFFQMVI